MGSKVSEMISDAIIRDTRKPQSTFIASTDTPTFGTPPLLNTATKHQEVKDGRDSIYYSQSGKCARVFRKPKVGETANTMISDRLADSAVSNMCRSAPIKVMHVDVEAAPGCYLRNNKSVPYFTQSVPNVNTTDMRSAFVENPNNSACPNQLLTTGSPSANAPCTLSNTTTLYPSNTVNFQHSNATQTAQRTRDGNFGRFKNVQFDLCSGNITAPGSTHCEMDICQHSTELYSLLRRKEQELHERDECIRRLKKVIRDKTQMLNDLMAKHSEMENKFETHIDHNVLMKRTHDRAIREQRTIMSDIVSSDSGVAHSTPSSGAKSCPYSDVNFDPSETLIRLNRDLPSDRQGIEGQHSDVDKDGRYRSGNKFSQQRRAKRYAISGESTKDLLTPSSPSANLPKFAKPER
ncbi:unnamed protein product [Dicrocoelium dendriticum]|nr:unnamed protein product [Dicrocoelium dendriticum]